MMMNNKNKVFGTQEIQTERLLLRRFTENDVDAIYLNWAKSINVTRFLRWEAHRSLGVTKTWLLQVLMSYENYENSDFVWAIELKESGELIGSLGAYLLHGNEAYDIGYCIGEKWWGHGYCAEALRAVLDYMIYDCAINRIEAYHSINNPARGKVMIKAGMLKEGTARQKYKTGDGILQDCDLYAIVKDDFESFYKPENPENVKFFDLDNKDISKHNVNLICREYYTDPTNKWFPAYKFDIADKGSGNILGNIDLRLGFREDLYYAGHIGYNVDEQFQNMGVATTACKIVLQIAKAHGFKRIIITNSPKNKASARVCEKCGLKLIRVAKLPEWHDIYKEGERYKNIYEIKF